MFNLMEKRLEVKIEVLAMDIHKVVEDMRDERRSKDHLYKFIMDYVKKNEDKK